MKRLSSVGLALAMSIASLAASASDWQVTYFGHPAGRLFIDKESISDSGAIKKFWVLYAPQVEVGKPGKGFAYSKTMLQIDCKERTAGTAGIIFYDNEENPHEAAVEDKSMRNIVPDSETEYLWKYVCKGDSEGALASPAGSLKKYLADQAKYTRENDVRVRSQERQ